MNQHRLFLQFALCFLFLLPAGQVRAEEPAECKEIARVYGEPICESDLGDPLPGAMEKGDLPEDMQQAVNADSMLRKRERLKALIWKKAVDKNLPGAHLQPTPEEVQGYRDLFSKAMEKSYEADKKTIALLKDAYESDRYGPEAKKQIEDLLGTVEMSVYFYEERLKHQKSTPGNFAFIAEKAEKQIATNMLGTWLFDKAMYDKYGGRLLVREDNLWPVDAYKTLFTDIKEQGDLQIKDPAYKDVMQEMEKGFTSLSYEELPKGDEMYDVYFTTPESPFQLGNNDARLETLKAWLDSLAEGNEANGPSARDNGEGK